MTTLQNEKVIPRGIALKRALVVVFGALLMAGLSVRTGVVAVTRLNAPTIALALNPNDARAQAQLAEKMIASGPASATNAVRLARNAIAREPSLVSALRTVAIYEALQNRPGRAVALLTQASHASKGDVGSQVLLIEAAVARNDIPTALYHYDIALRSSRDAAPLLFPPLIRASDEESIMLPLTNYLATNPAWKDGYLLELVQHGPSPVEVMSLLLRLKARGLPAGENIVIPFVNLFIAAGDIVQARQVFQTLLDPTPLDRLRDPGFRRTAAATPFDWALGHSYGLTVTTGPTEIGPGITISASPDCCGEVVGQLLTLPSGHFSLRWRERVLNSEPTVRAVWTVTCQSVEKQIVLSAPAAVQPNDNLRETMFEIPNNCNAQRVALNVRPGDDTLSFSVSGLSLARSSPQ